MTLPYPVVVGRGVLDRLPGLLRQLSRSNRIALVTDSNVAGLHGNRVARLLGVRAGDRFTVPAGERHKTRATWARLTDRMLAAGFGRDTTIVALGGGVVGDLAGFVAATYMRGVPVIQVPTTLLAMVDASVGGKTGVDTAAGKNLVGAFHQPSAVLADLDVLRTLPPKHLRAGFAEVIKHGVIADPGYFAKVRAFAAKWRGQRMGRAELAALLPIVRRSIAIKSAIVSRDEREGGKRKVLNFGHTIAHAVETATQFRILHGEAVAIGMVTEARIAERMGIAATGTSKAVAEVCGMAGLPTSLPRVSSAALLRLTRNDKKARGGKVEYALPRRIGAMAGAGRGWSIPVKDTIVRNALSKEA